MQLVFIHGPPAAGKLTVARELAAATGYPLFHNHLTVDLLRAVFELGSDPFVRLREHIWIDVFRELALAGRSFIFTFHPERTVGGMFLNDTLQTVEAAGGRVVFVALTCPEEEIERRLELPSRAASPGKLRSVEEYRRLRDSGAFDFPPLPEPLIEVDTGTTEPAAAAHLIQERLAASATTTTDEP